MSKYMLSDKKHIEIYNKFLDFKTIFLDNGISFFNQNIKLFEDNEVFDEFEDRIIKNYDDAKLSSIEKYKKQLKGANEKVRHFFANIVWLYNYPIENKTRAAKLKDLKTYLGEFFEQEKVEYSLLENGIVPYGRLTQFLYYDINFIDFFIKQYIRDKSNPNDIINNIKLFALMREILPNGSFKNMHYLASRHMLNYLFNPDDYEPIVNTEQKKEIVKKHLGVYKEETLDGDLYKIRHESFGFTDSLYSTINTNVNELNNNSPKVQPIKTSFNSDYKISISPKNNINEDLLIKEKTKMQNGLDAQELVYEEIISQTDKDILINKISQINKIKKSTISHNDIDKLIHYAKNYDKYAPFDLLSTKDKDILYIEVKSTTGDEIYFSKNEIKFAYNHFENYQIKVVKDKIIYDIDMQASIIENIYTEIFKSESLWSYETVKFNISFN